MSLSGNLKPRKMPKWRIKFERDVMESTERIKEQYEKECPNCGRFRCNCQKTMHKFLGLEDPKEVKVQRCHHCGGALKILFPEKNGKFYKHVRCTECDYSRTTPMVIKSKFLGVRNGR